MIKTNYHTHTKYCDGSNTPREMIEAAIDKGFAALGFSGHSHTPFDESYCMSVEATRTYVEEIKSLREEYAGRIEIYCGLEYDYYSDDSTSGLDYRIGSVHYVYKDGEYLTVDWDTDMTVSNVNDHYGGDLYAYCADYFGTVADVINRTHCDIVGHFDLITKFNEDFARLNNEHPDEGWDAYIIDENDPRYVGAYTAAIRSINDCRPGALVEINTGAMSNGRRSVPYPSLDILRFHRSLGGNIVISSDSHRTDTLDCGFEEAKALAKLAGYETVYILSGGVFQPAEIE